MNKIRVLHITNNFPTKRFPIFGIFVKEQINSLASIDLENDVYFINGRENGRSAYLNAIKVLRKKINNSNYDIIHCHHSFSALVLFLTFNFKSVKKIVSYQNPPKREGGWWLFYLIYFFFNGVILKSNIKSLKKLKKVYYLPNGVNTNFFKPINVKQSLFKTGLKSNKKYILFMDSYKRRFQKRLDRFRNTIEILTKNGNPYNIEPLILTNTNRSLIPFYMNSSKLHLLTSDFEGSPNSVKECLSCNIPVVSCPVGNINDLIGDIKGCYISKSFDSEELANLVIKCLSVKSFRGRKKLLSKKLDMNSVALKLKEIYKSILK